MKDVTELFCRVTRTYANVESVFIHLSKKVNQLIVYEHEADAETSRTHVHFYIEGCTVTVEGIKKMFKTLTSSEFTKYDWSFNTKNVDRNCITYMSKGILEPCYQHGDIDTKYSKELWEDKPKKYQTRLQFVTKESPSEAKKRKNDLIEEMIALMNERNDKSEDSILKVIIQILNDNKIIFSRYTIRDYFDTILSRSDPEKFFFQLRKFVSYNI